MERAEQIGTVTAGTEYEDGFLIDNVLAFDDAGEYRSVEELHYHIYVPKGYDGSRPYWKMRKRLQNRMKEFLKRIYEM